MFFSVSFNYPVMAIVWVNIHTNKSNSGVKVSASCYAVFQQYHEGACNTAANKYTHHFIAHLVFKLLPLV